MQRWAVAKAILIIMCDKKYQSNHSNYKQHPYQHAGMPENVAVR